MVTCLVKVYNQQQYDTHTDCHEASYEGVISQKNDNVFIIYKEEDSETGLQVTNQLKVSKDGSVSVRRMGDVKSTLHFKEDTSYTSHYDTGQGVVELVFVPTVVACQEGCQETGSGQTVELRYEIYMGDTKLSDNIYKVQVDLI